MPKIHRVLISVTDKSGVADFARRLADLGVEIVSTGGTARLLRERGLTVRDVSELTGFPEMLDGRVKTLHPLVAGGILAIRGNAEHMKAVEEHEIPLIDMVVVNLYAFEKTAAREGASFEDIVENIDVGGPSMIRAAAKNCRHVAVVTDPEDYAGIADELAADGELSEKSCWKLAQQAFAVTASYDAAIAGTLSTIDVEGNRDENPLPGFLGIAAPRKQSLRYGENPHQSAALYASGEAGIAGARKLHGKELSYNNLVDLDAAWNLAREFERPAAAIIKHTNPCGCAEDDTQVNAYRQALECDPVSAFGSVIAFNRAVDSQSAEALADLFVEAIVAPGFDKEAFEILTRKKNLRLLEVGETPRTLVIKSIAGGYLAQTEDDVTAKTEDLKVVTERAPTDAEMKALAFAWKVTKHVKSNAIVYVRDGQTVGVGAGQMSRVDAARIGAQKAVLPLQHTVVGSDAFFPFPDGVEEIASHGATAVIQPGRSKRDADVIAAANRLGLAMVFTGIRHFRH